MTNGSPAVAPPLSIITSQSGTGSVRIYLAGEIDMATAPQVRCALRAVLAAATAQTEIRVDLGRVVFIDAIGVGVLLGCRELARQAGVGFSVVNPKGMVLRIIEVLDLAGPLQVTPVHPASPSP